MISIPCGRQPPRRLNCTTRGLPTIPAPQKQDWHGGAPPDAANANAWGVYDPANGSFIPTKKPSTKPYGKGTKIDGKTVYTSEDGRKAYDASLDYTDGVVMVAIYPNGNNKHVDIYWKYTHAKDGHTDNAYIGGDQGASNPRYSLRIPLK